MANFIELVCRESADNQGNSFFRINIGMYVIEENDIKIKFTSRDDAVRSRNLEFSVTYLVTPKVMSLAQVPCKKHLIWKAYYTVKDYLNDKQSWA